MASIDQEIDSKIKDDKQRFIVNLMYTSGWLKNLFNNTLKPFDVSSQQFNILRILRGANDWLAMNVVKERMVEKSPNATRLADKLIDKGLIERERCDSDRRVVFLRITETGLKLLKEVDEIGNKEIDAFRDRISVEEAKQFSDILDKMRG